MKKTRNGMRITGLLLTMVMLVALLGAFSMTASAAEGTAIDLSSLTETYVISNSGEYIFTGSGCYGIKVASGNPTIVLNNANITVGEGSAIDVASGSNATIFVLGDNTIDTTETEYSDVPCGGIFVAEGGTVNITSNGTDNILRARGTLAAAIGGKYVYAGESYNAGSIGISNVTIYAYTNNSYAAAIGAAGRGSCGTINITNAVVYAYGAGDRWTSAPGIGSAWSLVSWSETIPVVIISGSEIHTFRYNYGSDYIGYLGDIEIPMNATGSINCGEGGSVKSSTIYCYTGLDATITDKTVKYGVLGGLLNEDGTCEGEHSGGTQTCMGYKCANCANWYGEKNDTHDWSGKVGICANGCGMTCDHSNATYPADGITDTQHKLVCSECGYEVTETHDFVDGECICSLKNFHIYGQQLNVGGDLSMKYYVIAFGDGVSTETLKMKFIFLGRETVVDGIYNAEMGMYVFTLEGITPQCMGDKIDAYLLLGDEEKASKLSYTVEENLLALREEYEDDEALVTLVNDILAYGTAASEYKDHNSMTDVYVGSDREIRETEWPALDIGFEGYTVVFGQVNYLKIKVNLAEGQTLYLDGVNVTAKVVDGIFKTDGIAPTNFDKKFNFEIRTDGVLFNAFSVSVDDYLSAKRESETMGKLVKALYNYGVSAEAYDHVKNGVGEHLDRVYAPNSSSTHQATCICGDVITDNHEFDTTNGKCICGAIQLTVVNAPDYDDDPFGDGWIDEKELRYTGSITETQDAGKYDWNDEDQIIVTLISETIGTQTCVLTYDDSIWTLNGSFVYAEGETPTVTAVYAPAGTSGLGDYIPANCTFAGSSITIDFNDVTRNYSRLRIVGAPNQTLTVTTTDFTPAGATIELGPEPFALTTDELGNAYLYGSFAEGANIIVKKGEVVLVEYAFNEEWTLGGTKPNTSYVLDARPIIDGTLGGKTTAEESDITALVEQLKAYVDNGITTIIVTGEDPAMYNLLGSDLPAVSAAIFFLGSSGSETNGDHDSPYCGTIDLIMPDATSLAYMEFCSTYALNSVTLPNVTKIADQAFHDTPYLRTITFGSVLTEVNETGGVMFAQVGKEVGGCELILNCGQMNESSVPTPDLTTNTWKFKFENEFKSITLTHTGECDECKANH